MNLYYLAFDSLPAHNPVELGNKLFGGTLVVLRFHLWPRNTFSPDPKVLGPLILTGNLVLSS